MDPESIGVRLRHLDALVLSGSDGSLRVLDKSARVACDVPADGMRDEEAVAAEIEGVLSASADSRGEPPIRLRVNVVSEALALDGVGRALAVLAEFLKPQAAVQLVLHFAEPPQQWEPVLSLVKSLRETVSQPKDLAIRATGPFAATGEGEMESLFDLGVRVSFAAGWAQDAEPRFGRDVDMAALREFSRFGFRAPVAWHVHANNITEIEDRLPETLDSNYSSGFSLPLASCSPYYRIDEGRPELPDAAEYCRLLVRTYRQYPYYDDVLFPLNELALLVRDGGWHFELDIPAMIQMLVGSNGQVVLYRQTPASGVSWTGISEVAAGQPESLREDVLERAAEAWQWQKNPYCRQCCWRYICGGLDVSVPLSEAAGQMDPMCEYRKLFLEHFALARAPNVVLKAAQETA